MQRMQFSDSVNHKNSGRQQNLNWFEKRLSNYSAESSSAFGHSHILAFKAWECEKWSILSLFWLFPGKVHSMPVLDTESGWLSKMQVGFFFLLNCQANTNLLYQLIMNKHFSDLLWIQLYTMKPIMCNAGHAYDK